MAKFNEKMNSHKKFFLFDQDSKYIIERVGSMCKLEIVFDDYLESLKTGYLLCIKYKYTHHVQKLADRCFIWDFAPNTIGGVDVRCLCLDPYGDKNLDNVGNPRFDHIHGAVLISDKGVYTYGDTRIEAVDIREEHVVCKAYVCGRFVSKIRIPAETFDRLFGLKENFPEQYEKQVQEKNDLINEAKRNIESCMNLLDTHECQLGRAMDAIKLALMDIEDQKCELSDILTKLDNTLRKLK